MDSYDTRMVQPGQSTGFTGESLTKTGVSRAALPAAQKDLEGDYAVQFGLADLVHRPHSTATKALQDFEFWKEPSDFLARRCGSRCGSCCLAASRAGRIIWHIGFGDEIQPNETVRTQPVRRVGSHHSTASWTPGHRIVAISHHPLINHEPHGVTRNQSRVGRPHPDRVKPGWTR